MAQAVSWLAGAEGAGLALGRGEEGTQQSRAAAIVYGLC